MSSERRISTAGRIVEVLENGCFRAELPNGKMVIAFPRKAPAPGGEWTFRTGDRVILELTPFDFSKAEITGYENF